MPRDFRKERVRKMYVHESDTRPTSTNQPNTTPNMEVNADIDSKMPAFFKHLKSPEGKKAFEGYSSAMRTYARITGYVWVAVGAIAYGAYLVGTSSRNKSSQQSLSSPPAQSEQAQ
eukprot:GILK01016812.1.p1 GENE.GILK01016812.1~~GILK01016812.1.p1  ORF type:complete len:116 (+),score=4.70 GILK01016812.1:49-396(+)